MSMLFYSAPAWLTEPDIRAYIVEPFTLDYLIDSKHISKPGYLLTLQRNGKTRACHFFTNKKEAEKAGKKYMKEEGKIKDN